MKYHPRQHGFILPAALMMISVLLALMGAYFTTSKVELATTRSTRDNVRGFYAAEAGLNMRAEDVRQTFVGYNLPTGTSPTEPGACEGTNMGSGDFACQDFTVGNRTVTTYVVEEAGNPVTTTVPQGERYQYLSAQEYSYTAKSISRGPSGNVEAQLELKFKSRLIPMFQFMAFYNKDLEILPGPSMTMNGPIHTNGDLYLNTDNSSPGLRVTGQITVGDSLYRGRKNTNVCNSNPVDIMDPAAYRRLIATCTTRRLIASNEVTNWNGMIQMGVEEVTVPDPEVIDYGAGNLYFDKADLRLALVLNSSNNPDTSVSTTGIVVKNSDGSNNSSATTTLHGCTGSLSGRPIASNTFMNFRESRTIRVLDVDMLALFNCLKTSNWFSTGKLLSDSTEGGLVFHFTVLGPNSAAVNGYGVRVRNGSRLYSNVAGAPAIRGLTVVSDQGFYVFGNYNSTNKIPAAFLVDVWNVLSNQWLDSHATYATRSVTGAATINAAVLSGTSTTGNIEGSGGQGGAYNGGLENYPRFHENWNGNTFTYVGSLVSLGNPRFSNGAWVYGSPVYTAPTRAWAYDTSFNNAANLPPLSPRFVTLRQEMFLRDFEQ